jgi:AAA family ATP:ADP antiporter
VRSSREARRVSLWSSRIRPEEARTVRLAFVAFFLLTSALAVLRPVREAWGIERGVDKLPWMITLTFALTVLIVPLYSRLVARASRRRIVPLVLHAVAGSLLLFHLALRFDLPRYAAGLAFFAWYSTLNLIIVGVFWSLMADLFRSQQARRLFGYISGGGSLGFLVGPLLAGQLVDELGMANLLLVSVVLLECTVVCVHRLQRGVAPAAPAGGALPPDRLGGSIWAGFTAVARQPYLRVLAAQMLLTTSAATVLYQIQAEIVSHAASGTEQRISIFANIDVWTNAVSLLAQLLITGPLLMRWGAGLPLRVASGALAASLLLLARWPLLPVLTAVQALRRASHYALERPALNLLFTVVGREEKYKAKGFTDTVVYRGGDAGASHVFNLLAGAGLGLPALSLAFLPLAAGGWWLAGVLSRRHRALECDTQLPLETVPGLRDPAAQEPSR